MFVHKIKFWTSKWCFTSSSWNSYSAILANKSMSILTTEHFCHSSFIVFSSCYKVYRNEILILFNLKFLYFIFITVVEIKIRDVFLIFSIVLSCALVIILTSSFYIWWIFLLFMFGTNCTNCSNITASVSFHLSCLWIHYNSITLRSKEVFEKFSKIEQKFSFLPFFIQYHLFLYLFNKTVTAFS